MKNFLLSLFTLGGLLFTVGNLSAQSTPVIGAGSGGVAITTVSKLANISGLTKGTIAAVTDGASGTDCTTGSGTSVVTCQYNGTSWAQLGVGGGMTWPTGGAGIPNYNGSSAWGTSYNASSPIPANFIAQIPLSQLNGGSAPSGQSYNFSAITAMQLRNSAGLTTSITGDFGFDSTNNNWHGWNGADLIFAPLASGFVSGDCGQPTNVTGKWTIADAGAACGSGGGGLSGMTAGQFPVAATASTITSSVAGSGTGNVCLTTNCVMTTPNLGTPSAINLTNATGAPTWNQNTTGTAANLSGTPTLPNGTSATTQALGNSSSLLATTGFVIANAITNPLTTLGDIFVENSTPAAARLAGCTLAVGVPCTLTSTPTSGPTAALPVWGLSGVPVNPNSETTCATQTLNILDRASAIFCSGGTTATFTLPVHTTSGFGANFPFFLVNNNSGTLTITPTTDSIDNGTVLSKWASLTYNNAVGNWQTIQVPQFAAFGSTCATAVNWSTTTGFGCTTQLPVVNVGSAGLSGTAPITVASTGAIGCATCVTSAAALTSNAVVIGGGGQASSTISASTTTTFALFATAGAPAFRALATTDMPGAVVQTGQTNVYGAFLQDFTSGTMEVPEAAGFTTNVNSTLGLDTTNNAIHMWVNSADSVAAVEASVIAAGFLPKSTDATHGLLTATLCDEAQTTANTLTCTDTAGIAAPKFISTGTTAGFIDFPQGSTSSAVAPCNVATSICEQAPTSVTSYLITKPGAAPNIASYKQTDGCAAASCTESFHPVPVLLTVASDFIDSTSTTLQLITGLSTTLPVSKAVVISFHCSLIYDQATSAVSDSFGIGITGTAPTQANASGTAYTSTSALTTGTLTGLASTTPTAVVTFTPSAITTIWKAELDGTVEQPSNATPGVFGIYVASTTGTDNFLVKRGSYCRVTYQ